jgi:hypothetical protein
MEFVRMAVCPRLFPLLGAVTLAACRQTATTDNTVNSFQATARSVVVCQTTEADLRRDLGEPSRDGILHGARVLTWIIPGTSSARYLAVLVDTRGVVADLYWDIPTAVPWTPTNQCTGRQGSAAGVPAQEEKPRR